ncbi:PDDEXK nuclease domain-containing protein [Neolewinella persica]|uniref:PDDEXK nuclease domain-containing protein n=1 Tax=Neolewinella persica TaxID=70998 RepID=UPI000372B901|nr:PDDEXK nuclease domain-containing protein [Neolewinella persica]
MSDYPVNNNQHYHTLVQKIGDRYAHGRATAVNAVNHELVLTYWEIGRYIVEFEQAGAEKASYGKQLINQLAKDLTIKLGKGFGRTNLNYIRLLYLKFPKSGTLSRFLTWSHYYELLKLSSDNARSFYEQQTIIEKWSVRELKRQKTAGLYERLARSKNKEEILELARKGKRVVRPEDLIREPLVLDFLKLPENKAYLESELEERLITHLKDFMLELGKGYAFVGRQYRITIGDDHHYVDLVFYHYILHCFVLIDLKTRKARPGDVGQMNMYLSYFASEESGEGDNPPVGIVLATGQNNQTISFALEGIPNNLLVTKYQTYLPLKGDLEAEIERVISAAEEE